MAILVREGERSVGALSRRPNSPPPGSTSADDQRIEKKSHSWAPIIIVLSYTEGVSELDATPETIQYALWTLRSTLFFKVINWGKGGFV